MVTRIRKLDIVSKRVLEKERGGEAAKRKARSQDILRKAGVAINAALPEIETSDQIELRTASEIARRAVCLLLVASQGELDAETTQLLIEDLGMIGYFTKVDQAFLDRDSPSEEDLRNLGWRSEACWVLLWALAFVEGIGIPIEQTATGESIDIVESNGLEGLVTTASVRSMSDILDAADLIYRSHWATRSF